MTDTTPGWYDDGHGTMRWYDGTQWTEHTQAPPRKPKRRVPLVGSMLLSIGALVLGIIIGTAAANAGHQTEPAAQPAGVNAPEIPPATHPAAPTVTPVTFKGDGEMNTTATRLEGDYRLDWETKGYCYYSADLEGADSHTAAFTADSPLKGTNNIHGLDAGDYYLQVITGPAPKCGWTVTLVPVE